MSAGYRFLAVDLLSHKLLAELPLTGVSWSQTLNAAGELDATLSIPDDAVTARIFLDAVQPLRRAIYVERDGVLLWGGPLWLCDLKTPGTAELRAFEWWSIFAKRLIDPTVSFVSDQLTIAHVLVSRAQSLIAGSGLNISVGTDTSGVTRTQAYNDYEAHTVADAVAQLAATDDGFDFAITVQWDDTAPGNVRRRFVTYYPHRGRLGSQTGFVFEVGRNIVALEWPIDGSNVANSVVAFGSGDGTDMVRERSTRTDLLDEGYPLLEEALTLRDVTDTTALTAHADAYAAAKGLPVVLPQIVVKGDVDPVLGSYLTGDEVRIRVQRGTDARFPDGIDEYRRITAFKVTVPDSGASSETVAMTLDLPLS